MVENYRIVGLAFNNDTGTIETPPRLRPGNPINNRSPGWWIVNDDITITVDNTVIFEENDRTRTFFDKNPQRCQEGIEGTGTCNPLPTFQGEPDITQVQVQAFNGPGGGRLDPIAIQHTGTAELFPLVTQQQFTSRNESVFVDLLITAPEPPPCTVNTFLRGQGIDVEIPIVGEVSCLAALVGGTVIGITLLAID